MLGPFRGFRDMQSEMERMMGEALGSFGRRQPRRGAPAEEWTPAVDVIAGGGELVIRAELPGVKREDVDVSVHNEVLTISGERKEEIEEKGSGYLLRERHSGSFRRSMNLPEGADEDRIKARFEDGVLEVRIEGGRQVSEPRRVEIGE